MAGETLESVPVRWTGLFGDRQFGFVRTDDRSHFPWLTGRVYPEIVRFRASYANPEDPRHSPVRVDTPDGSQFDVWDHALTERLAASGDSVRPMRLGRGAFDQHAVSIVTRSMLVRLVQASPTIRPDRLRFRCNIVIDDDGDSGSEADWIGRSFQFGPDGAVIRIDEAIERCAMIGIDPETGRRDRDILRLVASAFDNRMGLYGTPVTLGHIRVGEPVYRV